VRQDPVSLWIARKYCLIGIRVAYSEVRRNVMLSCFFQCLKEGEDYSLMSSIYCVFFLFVELVEAVHYQPEGRGFDSR